MNTIFRIRKTFGKKSEKYQQYLSKCITKKLSHQANTILLFHYNRAIFLNTSRKKILLQKIYLLNLEGTSPTYTTKKIF